MAIFLLGISCREQPARNTLNIAVAANMQYAMEALVKEFTQTTGISCELVVSSSGKLTAQILEGAPFHLLVSADMKYPEALNRNGKTIGPPQVYAYGKLVLWTLQDNVEPSLEVLESSAIRHIAMANPKTAPYGRAAMEVLRNSGWYEQVRDKIVYGESIAQTNQFITSRAAELGFTALSVVVAPQVEGQGRWSEIDPSLYAPIAQGVVVMQHPEGIQNQAMQFRDFLFSDRAREMLINFGYSVDE
jgi:molybdate transport system substrate-binding protein